MSVLTSSSSTNNSDIKFNNFSPNKSSTKNHNNNSKASLLNGNGKKMKSSTTDKGKKRARSELESESRSQSHEESHNNSASGNSSDEFEYDFNNYENDNEIDDDDDEFSSEDYDESNHKRKKQSKDKDHVNKKQRRVEESERQEKTKQEEEFAKREAELDEELPAQYRKFRPRGYKFNIPPQDRPVRVYADGVFDLFHLGHMKQLEQSKKALSNTTLIVGIPSDKETHKHKGLTVLAATHRAESLRHCRWVDEVIEDAPWSVTPEFLKKHKIDYVAHDDLPYASAGDDDIYKPMKEKGMFLTTQRTEGISTSDIITKIIRDYDKYLMRNFARGASRKDLNVSWLKKNELDLKRHVFHFRESFKTGFEQAKNRDIYSEIMGYIANHLTPRRKSVGSNNNSNNNNNNNENNDSDKSPIGTPKSSTSDNGQRKTRNEFISKYSGAASPHKRGFFDNVKGWVSRKIDSNAPSPSISASPSGPNSPEYDNERR